MDGLSNLGEGFWDSLTSLLPASADATAKIMQAYNNTGAQLSAAQIAALQAAEQERQAKTRTYLIVGGLAVGALALVLYMRKK
jgi:hypothetical protein